MLKNNICSVNFFYYTKKSMSILISHILDPFLILFKLFDIKVSILK